MSVAALRPVQHVVEPRVRAADERRPRVLVVDDHALVGHGVALALHAEGMDAEVCAPVSADAVLERAARLAPDVVLLDLLPGDSGVGGVDLIRPLMGLGAAVVAFTGSVDPILLATSVEAGVIGIISKADPFERMLEDVRRAAHREPVLPVTRREELLQHLRRHRAEQRGLLAPFTTLTPREGAVLERLMHGESAESIAASSYVALSTVRSQIRAVLTKLGVSSQLAAVAMAYGAGWRAQLTAAT